MSQTSLLSNAASSSSHCGFRPTRTQCEQALAVASAPHEALSTHLATDFYEQMKSTTTRAPLVPLRPAPEEPSPDVPATSKDELKLQANTPLHHSYHLQDNLLARRLLGDVAIGVAVTAGIAPSLTAVDKALVQCAAQTHTFSASFAASIGEMARHPLAYLKSPAFLWMWATYASTYVAANCFDSLSQENERRQQQQPRRNAPSPSQGSVSTFLSQFNVSSSTMASAAFVGTTAANSAAALCKDAAYARLFAGQVVPSIPAPSYALWLARDFTVIGSSFVAPPHVARYLDEQVVDNNNSTSSPSQRSLAVAQFLTPVAAQLVAGPLHFLGLDVCNRQGTVAWTDRLRHLQSGLSSVLPARMVRILPGYGVGGVWNQRLRAQWNAHLLEEQHVELQHEARTTTRTEPHALRSSQSMWRQTAEHEQQQPSLL